MFPSPSYLPDSGIKLTSPALAGRFFTTEPPGKILYLVCRIDENFVRQDTFENENYDFFLLFFQEFLCTL